MTRVLRICFVWIMLSSGSLAADSGFFIHDGDRVVFLGDSITEQKLYTTYIEAYTVTRFPKQEFHFWNSGWGVISTTRTPLVLSTLAISAWLRT